jgi:hypothetical protein
MPKLERPNPTTKSNPTPKPSRNGQVNPSLLYRPGYGKSLCPFFHSSHQRSSPKPEQNIG